MSDVSVRAGTSPVPSPNLVSHDETLRGDGSSERPLGVVSAPFVPPYPNPVPLTTTINARIFGSDATGDGSLDNPFRTFQRAIREVPNVIGPGLRYYVDITGIGVEELPVGYQFPPFQGCLELWTFGDPSTLPFLFSAAVNVRAMPQPFSALPAPDRVLPAGDIASITAVPGPSELVLVTATAPRASWAAGGAKGALVIGSGGSANVNCTVYDSDSTHLLLTNTVGNVAIQDLSLVEDSAELRALGAGADGAGIQCASANSFCLQGVKLSIVGGGSAFNTAILICNAPQPVVELCDVDGLAAFGVSVQLLSWACVIRGGVNMEGAGWSPRRSLVLNAETFFFGGGPNILRQMVFDGCGSLGPSGFTTGRGALPQSGWEIFDCILQNSTGDAIAAAQAGAYSIEQVEISNSNGAGVSVRGSLTVDLTTVEINDCAGDGVFLRGSCTVDLTTVTGSGNVGFGVDVQDGASCHVHDNATLITGGAGDTKVGNLAAYSWANFRGVNPIKNRIDLSTPFVADANGVVIPVGDEVTGVGTGGRSMSRLYQTAP